MSELFMIFGFIVILTAIVMGVGSDIYRRHLKFKEREMSLMAENAAEQAAQYATKAEKLEQRVRVLERIATDRGQDLAAQIDDLRDEQVTGERVS